MKISLSAIAVFSGAALYAAPPPQQTQLPPHTISAVNLTTDLSTGTFAVDIRNDSNKDVTAAAYTVDVRYADGTAQTSQFSFFDVMVTIGMESQMVGGGQIGVIHPGKSYHVQQPVPRLRGNGQVAGVAITPTAVIYLGGSAQGDEAQLNRIFEFRRSIAAEVQIWAKAFSEVSRPDQYRDMVKRAKSDRAALEAQRAQGGAPNSGRDPGMLQGLIQTFDSGVRMAGRGGVTLDQVIQAQRQYLTHLNQVCQSESVR